MLKKKALDYATAYYLNRDDYSNKPGDNAYWTEACKK